MSADVVNLDAARARRESERAARAAQLRQFRELATDPRAWIGLALLAALMLAGRGQ